jgi:hypothetical protein
MTATPAFIETMRFRIRRAALLLLAITVAGTIGFTAPSSVAVAQGSYGDPGGQGEKNASKPATSKPGSVTGVTVEAPPKPETIPADKKAALDAETARREAWKSYRNTTPTATVTTTTGGSPQVENYPGLRDAASH